MKMSLTEISTLITQGNTVVNEISPHQGKVTRIVFGKNFQGLHIPNKISTNMSSNISCGKEKLFVVKTGDMYYEIHNSKTAFMRFQKQK